jgi:hypothetical protein
MKTTDPTLEPVRVSPQQIEALQRLVEKAAPLEERLKNLRAQCAPLIPKLNFDLRQFLPNGHKIADKPFDLVLTAFREEQDYMTTHGKRRSWPNNKAELEARIDEALNIASDQRALIGPDGLLLSLRAELNELVKTLGAIRAAELQAAYEEFVAIASGRMEPLCFDVVEASSLSRRMTVPTSIFSRINRWASPSANEVTRAKRLLEELQTPIPATPEI